MLAMAAEHGGNPDDPNKRDPLDFVLWQPSLPDEPSWESRWGPGRPGLAHRVLGAGPPGAGGDGRRPRRRPGSGLPPPRVRDGPVRVGHRPALRPPLAPHRPGRTGRHQDVQVARQPGLRRRPDEGVGAGGHPAGPARPPLPTSDWEWTAEDMPHAAARLAAWRAAPLPWPMEIRLDDRSWLAWSAPHLDDDLDTPGALAALDVEAAAGPAGPSWTGRHCSALPCRSDRLRRPIPMSGRRPG